MMKTIKKIGLGLFLIGLTIFTSLLFQGEYKITTANFEHLITSKNIKSELFISSVKMKVIDKNYTSQFTLSDDIITILENASEEGSVSAQAALAYCYEKGLSVKQNKAEAADLYRKAAHRGSQAAFNSLRAMYDQLRPGDDEYDIFEE